MKSNQEDSFAPDKPDQDTRCFVVCDGVGGLDHGEIASRVTARHIESDFLRKAESGAAISEELIRSVIEEAWKELDTHLDQKKEEHQMATTLAMAVVDCSTDTAWIAHIGDSRVYVVRPKKKQIVYVTKDHTLAEELKDMGAIKENEVKNHPLSHTITKAMTPGERAEADIDAVKLQKGDYIFLCSDGVTEETSDKKLLEILTGNNNDEEKMRMIKYNSRKAKDNNTAVLVPIGKDNHTMLKRILWIALLATALLFLFGSLHSKAQSQADRQRVATLVMETNRLYKQKNYAGAALKLEEISQIMPNLDWPYLRLANIYKMNGQTHNLEKAIACYERYAEKCKKPAAVDSIKKIVAALKQADNIPVTAEQQKQEEDSPTPSASVTAQQPVAAQQPVNVTPATAPVTTAATAPTNQPVASVATATTTTSPTPQSQTNSPSESAISSATSSDAAVSILDEMFGDDSAAGKPTEAPTNKPSTNNAAQNTGSMVEIDSNKPLITYRHPFNVLRGDITNIKSPFNTGSNNIFVSALFNHNTGRDAIAFFVDANKQITLNPESDIEKAYQELMGNSNMSGTVHGITDETACTGNEWRIRMEYRIPDTPNNKRSWREVVEKMIGNYFNQAPVAEQLMLNEMDYIDKENKGEVTVVYDYNLEQLNGVLYGNGTIKATKKIRVIQTQKRTVSRPPLYVERTISVPTSKKNKFVTEVVIDTIAQADTTVIDTIKNKDEEYLLASVTSSQLFAPVTSSYVVGDLQDIPEEEEVENLEALRKEYDDFCAWHKDNLTEDYSATEIFNKVSQLSRMFQPEAIYTAYTGYLTGTWALPRNTRIANTYKKRMIRIQKHLKQ